MQDNQMPPKFPIPFGKNAGVGYIRQVPQASQIGIVGGAASLETGFPPLTFLPVGSGGIPPWGQDFNGLLNQISSWNRWQAAGGPVFFDLDFCTQIGGYPNAAVVVSTVTVGLLWLNTLENNTTNPDGAGAVGWLPMGPAAFAKIIRGFFVGTDTGSANAMIVASTDPDSSHIPLSAGMVFLITKAASSNTGSITLTLNSQVTLNVIWADNSVCIANDWPASTPAILEYNGTEFRILSVMGPSVFARVSAIPNILGSSLVHYGVDTGTANAITVASVTPTLSSVAVGTFFEIQKAGQDNSGPMTATICGQGGDIIWPDGSAMAARDWPGDAPALLMFDYHGKWSYLSMPGPTVFARVGGPSSASLVHYGVASGTNTLTTTLAPVITALTDGTFVELVPSNNNTGAVTLNCNGTGAVPVTHPNGSALGANLLQAGQVAYMTAKNAAFQLISSGGGSGAGTLTNVQVFTSSSTYNPTTGAQSALIIATGGGGSGNVGYSCGGGGSAGSTAMAFLNLSGISNVMVTIGGGGSSVTAGSGGSALGNSGGTTQFGSYAVAGGGNSGNQYAAGALGGTASAGLVRIKGGDGDSVTSGNYGNNSGTGGPSFWGGGGRGDFAGNYTASGSAYGSGGGGADSGYSSRTSGNGAPGIVVVLEF